MGLFKKLLQRVKFSLTGQFLCDTCKYDYGSVCTRSERPNAEVCPDYEHK